MISPSVLFVSVMALIFLALSLYHANMLCLRLQISKCLNLFYVYCVIFAYILISNKYNVHTSGKTFAQSLKVF